MSKDKPSTKAPMPCMTNKCGGKAVTRGLCGKCYSAASNMVKKKEVTWEQLEAAGWCKPSSKATAPNPFMKQVEEAKAAAAKTSAQQ
jgi:hypothetical protein